MCTEKVTPEDLGILSRKTGDGNLRTKENPFILTDAMMSADIYL